MFLSADTKQGNIQGMNPYGYVGGNPETDSDPTGRYYAPPGGPGGPTPPPPCNQSNNFCNTGHGGNPGGPSLKKTQVNLGGCDAKCENDKLLIQQYIQNERTKAQAINNAVADILSLVADIFAAAADFAAGAYAAFIIDVVTITGHFLGLLANLNNLGIVHISSSLVTLADMFQNAAPILSGIKGVVQWIGLGPLAGLASWLINDAKLEAKSAIMSMVPGLISAITAQQNDLLDLTKYNAALDAVDTYSAQNAYTVCLQDYSSDPGRC